MFFFFVSWAIIKPCPHFIPVEMRPPSSILVEHYDYQKYRAQSWTLLWWMLPLLFLILVVTLTAMYVLSQHSNVWTSACFWVLFCLLLAPLFYNQVVAGILSVVVLFYFWIFSRIRPKPMVSHRWLLALMITTVLLYGVCVYCLVSFVLYIYGNVTVSDLSNSRFYTQPFLEVQQLPVGLSKPRREEFERQILLGKQRARTLRVVIGSLARNIRPYYTMMRNKMETLGAQFKDYRIVLFENDSSDGSRRLLMEWGRHNPRVELLTCCAEGDCQCRMELPSLHTFGMRSVSRIDNMRRFRQRMLDHIRTHCTECDIFVLLDFDLPGALYLDGFLSTFARDDWDAVFARGLTSLPMVPYMLLYDSFAFVGEGQDWQYRDTNFREFQNMNRLLNSSKIGDRWIRCKSGFNGMTVYRVSSLSGATYFIDRPHKCEHIDLHFSMSQQGHDRLFFNPSMVLFAGHQGTERKSIFLEEAVNVMRGAPSKPS